LHRHRLIIIQHLVLAGASGSCKKR
jgi:hypothetical protein